ncbi:hypothetical protein F5Y12DRAFT_431111 [Xylaria sp. FL1777]|nr:hypothetical protein F5Y12DRAFT_431111 [Xylaria sp. FL1777]
MPPQRPRQHRRSACNRCRTYKLRCERDPSEVEGLCQRCRKTGAECTTSTSSISNTVTSAPIDPGPRLIQKDAENRTGSVSSSSYDLGTEPIPVQRRDSATTAAHAENPSPVLIHTRPLDFDLSYFTTTGDNPDSLLSPSHDKSHAIDWRDVFTESPLNDVASFHGPYTDSTPQSQVPKLTNPASSSLRQSVHTWCGSLATPLSHVEVAGFDDSNADLMSLHSHNDSDGGADVTQNYLTDILELSLRLAEDHESLQTADVYPPYRDNEPNPVETAVQRAMDRSSRFCDLLKKIVNSDRSPTSISSLGRSKTRDTKCVVLTTSVVTAYILLMRNWRLIFTYLYRLLVVRQPPPNRDLAIMPILQFGGSRVQSSSATQVAVLIELSFDMLGQIEIGLGADYWGVSGARKGSTGGQQHPSHGQESCIVKGPVAISVRDMLLTQEMVRLTEGVDELDTLSLTELADQLKSRLKDQA